MKKTIKKNVKKTTIIEDTKPVLTKEQQQQADLEIKAVAWKQTLIKAWGQEFYNEVLTWDKNQIKSRNFMG